MLKNDSPVWLITGCSTGFGRALAQCVISKGWRVAVTARDQISVVDIVEDADGRGAAFELDVRNQGQIEAVVAEVVSKFGRIDVLVNNAGYGYQSTVEEGVEHEIREQFDTNVFGLFALTRAVLPVMRAQRWGRIINITSVAGLLGFAGSGYYSASKHAVEGWSDSLRGEVEGLGIGVTCVEPGPFRTDWAGRSLRQTANEISDYFETAGKRLNGTKEMSGRQPGDPVRASEAIIAVAESSEPPRHLVLGALAFNAVVDRMEKRLEEIRKHKKLSLSADYPH